MIFPASSDARPAARAVAPRASGRIKAWFALLVVLLSARLAPAALAFEPFTVRDIRVEGVQRTDAGTVFSYLPIKVGDRIDDEKASAAVKALYATGFFRAEQEFKRQYINRGYYAMKVTTTATPQERNRVAVNFTVEEGDVAKIANINIVGAKAFPEKALISEMQLTTPGWLTWYTKNDQYSKQKLQADLEALRSFYQDRGYLEFAIDSTQVSITPDKEDIYITVNVTEGPRYTVSDVKLAGELTVSE